MKFLLLFLLISTISLLVSCDRNNLENTTWKNCGDSGLGPDVMIFGETYLHVRNDSIFYSKNDTLIATIDRVEYYYGERRLFIKDAETNVTGRYCEQ